MPTPPPLPPGLRHRAPTWGPPSSATDVPAGGTLRGPGHKILNSNLLQCPHVGREGRGVVSLPHPRAGAASGRAVTAEAPGARKDGHSPGRAGRSRPEDLGRVRAARDGTARWTVS